jgi:hypothetical protein
VYPVNYGVRRDTIRKIIQGLYFLISNLRRFKRSRILTKVILTRRSKEIELMIFDLAKNKIDYFSKVARLLKFIKENIGEKTKADSLSNKLRSDKQFMLEIAQLISGFQFKDFPDKTFWNDKAFALEVLKIDGLLLEYVSTNLKGDRDIVFLALSTNPYSVLYADPKFYKDRDYMGLAIEKKSSSVMDMLREPLISDVNFLIESLSKIKKSELGGQTNIARDVLKSVPLTLRRNKQLVISCLELNGWSIESVPDEIKYDKDILVAAFKSGSAVYKDLDLKKLLTLYKPAELKTIIKNEYYLKEVLAG